MNMPAPAAEYWPTRAKRCLNLLVRNLTSDLAKSGYWIAADPWRELCAPNPTMIFVKCLLDTGHRPRCGMLTGLTVDLHQAAVGNQAMADSNVTGTSSKWGPAIGHNLS